MKNIGALSFIAKSPSLALVFLASLSGTIILVISICCATPAYSGEKSMQEPIHESLWSTPFPLAQGGEKIDALVRVTKPGNHYFNLVFVEKREWEKEKKYNLMKVFRGWVNVEDFPHRQPYPIKLRFQLDSADNTTQVHIEEIVAERKHVFDTFPSQDTIWRANNIHFPKLESGIYRVRVENLNPCPEISWIETMFQFQRDNRKP